MKNTIHQEISAEALSEMFSRKEILDAINLQHKEAREKTFDLLIKYSRSLEKGTAIGKVYTMINEGWMSPRMGSIVIKLIENPSMDYKFAEQ